MNFHGQDTLSDRVEKFLNDHGFSPNSRFGYYFYYLAFYTLLCQITNRKSLSTSELGALEKHLTHDANKWGVTKPSVRFMSREFMKYLDSLSGEIFNFIKSEQGNLPRYGKTYFSAVENYKKMVADNKTVYYTKDPRDPYNDTTSYGPYSDIT